MTLPHLQVRHINLLYDPGWTPDLAAIRTVIHSKGGSPDNYLRQVAHLWPHDPPPYANARSTGIRSRGLAPAGSYYRVASTSNKDVWALSLHLYNAADSATVWNSSAPRAPGAAVNPRPKFTGANNIYVHPLDVDVNLIVDPVIALGANSWGGAVEARVRQLNAHPRQTQALFDTYVASVLYHELIHCTLLIEAARRGSRDPTWSAFQQWRKTISASVKLELDNGLLSILRSIVAGSNPGSVASVQWPSSDPVLADAKAWLLNEEFTAHLQQQQFGQPWDVELWARTYLDRLGLRIASVFGRRVPDFIGPYQHAYLAVKALLIQAGATLR